MWGNMECHFGGWRLGQRSRFRMAIKWPSIRFKWLGLSPFDESLAVGCTLEGRGVTVRKSGDTWPCQPHSILHPVVTHSFSRSNQCWFYLFLQNLLYHSCYCLNPGCWSNGHNGIYAHFFAYVMPGQPEETPTFTHWLHFIATCPCLLYRSTMTEANVNNHSLELWPIQLL